jgi:hypothetical protein
MAVFGFAVDVLNSALLAVRASNTPLSVTDIFKAVISASVKTGVKCTGTICGIPWGWKGMPNGAMESVQLARFKVMMRRIA